MMRFSVIVRTGRATYAYTAINTCSTNIVTDALDRFGLCCVIVKAQS